MKPSRLLALGVLVVLLSAAFPGCETTPSGDSLRREAMNAAIRTEAPGDYVIGRRFYKQDYKFWGWIRQPGQPWSTAKLVMLNEQKMLAPDRQQNQIGADNNFEYRLSGRFSGDTVYEPASDSFYPEFILTGYEIRSLSPANIFLDPRELKPEVRLLTPPR